MIITETKFLQDNAFAICNVLIIFFYLFENFGQFSKLILQPMTWKILI